MKKHNFAHLTLVTVSGILGVLLVIGICTSLLPGMWNAFTQVGEEVVNRFGEITDKFVGEFLTHEGESVEEAKERLASEQAAREEEAKAAAEERAAASREIVGTSRSDIALASIEASMNQSAEAKERATAQQAVVNTDYSDIAKTIVEASLDRAKASVEASKNAGKRP